jgi:hypothetical protein
MSNSTTHRMPHPSCFGTDRYRNCVLDTDTGYWIHSIELPPITQHGATMEFTIVRADNAQGPGRTQYYLATRNEGENERIQVWS